MYLRVTVDNPVKVFNSPGKVMAFINSLRTPTDTSDALGVDLFLNVTKCL